jgi:ABC-type glycerol-3-phosphate transport system substrate-binding protein
MRRPFSLGLIVTASALLGMTLVPTMTSAATSQVNLIEWVNPPAVAATRAIDAEFLKADHVKVNLTTAVGETTNYATLEKTSVIGATQDIMANAPLQPIPTGMPVKDLASEQTWAESGVYLPLGGQPWVRRLVPASKQAETYNNKMYGMSTGSYQVGVFYNKTIFARHHVTTPSS